MTATKIGQSNGVKLNKKPLGERIAKGFVEVGGSMTAGATTAIATSSIFPNLVPTALTTAAWTIPGLDFAHKVAATAAIAAAPPVVTGVMVPALMGAAIGLVGMGIVKGTIAAGNLIGTKIQEARKEKVKSR